MSDLPDHLDVQEYAALRATIRERGTTRLAVIALTFVSWAVLLTASRPFGPGALLALAPLLVLAAGFEVVFAAHTGVEKIGRYLQLRYETGAGSQRRAVWETLAMDLGRASPGSGAAPLAWPLFLLATALNGVAAWLGSTAYPGRPLLAVLTGLLHVAFAWRVLGARRAAIEQRERDLAAISGWLAAREGRLR